MNSFVEIQQVSGLLEVGFGLHMLWQCDARQVLHVLLRKVKKGAGEQGSNGSNLITL